MDKISLTEMKKLAGLIPTSPGFPDEDIEEAVTPEVAGEKLPADHPAHKQVERHLSSPAVVKHPVYGRMTNARVVHYKDHTDVRTDHKSGHSVHVRLHHQAEEGIAEATYTHAGKYSDPSAAHEAALRLQSKGWRGIRIDKKGGHHHVTGHPPEEKKGEGIAEAKAGKIKWEKKAEVVFVAFVKVAHDVVGGKERTTEIALRIDGREGTWRADMKSMSVMPWEAIDDGKGFGSQREAQDFAQKWVEKANAQKTLHPNMKKTAEDIDLDEAEAEKPEKPGEEERRSKEHQRRLKSAAGRAKRFAKVFGRGHDKPESPNPWD